LVRTYMVRFFIPWLLHFASSSLFPLAVPKFFKFSPSHLFV
jgi:hypothetical protein